MFNKLSKMFKGDSEGAEPGKLGPDNALVAIITMDKGIIRFVLMDQVAPITVANFIKLANAGFYNGLPFHRIVPGFVIQGGDPKGDGTGGPGWSIKGEFTHLPHLKGAVAMARTKDPDSAGSQFYICLEAAHSLDGSYAVFGYVIEGMAVVHAVAKGDKMSSVTIKSVPRSTIPSWIPE